MVGDSPADVGGGRAPPGLTTFLDTNVALRHLTGEPPSQGRRATAFLASTPDVFLTDVIAAETVHVLESFYELPRAQVARLLSAIIALPNVRVADEAVLLRAIEVYEVHRLHFADAYLVACAELSGVGEIASFDRSIDRVTSVRRREPS